MGGNSKAYATLVSVLLSLVLLLFSLFLAKRFQVLEHRASLTISAENAKFSAMQFKPNITKLIREELSNSLNFSKTSEEIKLEISKRLANFLNEISKKLDCEVFVADINSKIPLSSYIQLFELSSVELYKEGNLKFAKYVFTGGKSKTASLVFKCTRNEISAYSYLRPNFSIEVISFG